MEDNYTGYDKIYRDIVMNIIEKGTIQDFSEVRAKYSDGSPAYTKFVQGVYFKVCPEDGIPILRSKRVFQKTPLIELEWIWQELSNDVTWLQERKCKVWNEWVNNKNTIGKAYGYQLGKKCRKIEEQDLKLNQVEYILYQLKKNPNSRRIMTSLWNIDDLDEMTLEPCVWATNWRVSNRILDLHVKQRSADMALGHPFNVYQYAILHRLIANHCDLELGTLHWCIDDAHIYDRHIDILKEQLSKPLPSCNPVIVLPEKFDSDGKKYSFFERKLSSVKLENYKHNGIYKYEIAE
ncbi:thymidylate synthase [Enterococcus canintestini]|uniref:thymidylate synthase n=1 Tax=Enterococcus canintestini TaxID=317010 RepID=UPI002891AD37|nr:thymidylate synthase [Enterococcus canintestini]MDT2738734.1 thymidylate synthase [Enterococcus canintestini]